jgi:hypothetical protein
LRVIAEATSLRSHPEALVVRPGLRAPGLPFLLEDLARLEAIVWADVGTECAKDPRFLLWRLQRLEPAHFSKSVETTSAHAQAPEEAHSQFLDKLEGEGVHMFGPTCEERRVGV